MTVIKDGSGTNLLARVDNQNRLHIASIDTSEPSHVSIHDHLTFATIGTTTITASTEKTVILLINNTASTHTLAIDLLRISLQGETGKPATFKSLIGRTTYSSGGVAKTPVNLYANSTNVLDVSVYDNSTNDLVIGGSDSQIQQAFLESTTTYDTNFNSTVILPPNSSFRVTVTGDATAAGTKIAFARVLYFDVDETLHH